MKKYTYSLVVIILNIIVGFNISAQIIDIQAEYNSKNDYINTPLRGLIVDWDQIDSDDIFPENVVYENYNVKVGISTPLYKFIYFKTEVGSSTNDFKYYIRYEQSNEEFFIFSGDYMIDQKYIGLLPEIRFKYSVFGLNIGWGPNLHFNNILKEDQMLRNVATSENYDAQISSLTVGHNFYLNFTVQYKRIGLTFGICNRKIPIFDKTDIHPGISLKQTKLNFGVLYLLGDTQSGYNFFGNSENKK